MARFATGISILAGRQNPACCPILYSLRAFRSDATFLNDLLEGRHVNLTQNSNFSAYK